MPLALLAQQAGKVPRIGFLLSETLSGQEAIRVEALRAGLRDRGYVEGRNYAIEIRSAEGNYDRLPGLAAELARLKVAVLVPFGIKALLAARGATTSIPIVIPSTSSDPVALGLVASLSRPGGNITGSTAFGPEIMAKRLELLKEVMPRITRVAVLVNPSNPSFMPTFRQMDSAAKSLKLSLQTFEIRAPGEFDRVFAAIGNGRFDAIMFQGDTMFGGGKRQGNCEACGKAASSCCRGREFCRRGRRPQLRGDHYRTVSPRRLLCGPDTPRRETR